jgi:hypothetical protein
MNFRYFKLVSVFLLVLLFLRLGSCALGVSPAKIEINFAPNFEGSYEFRVSESDSEKVIELYVKGDLAEYVTLNKETIKGSGSFTATLKLPEKISKPGKNRILIGVRERVDEELSTIGTSLAVQAPIDVFVPYPGRYAEINLKGNNVNIGESVKFKLDISNRGKENISAVPRIEIFSNATGERTEIIYFKPRTFLSQETTILYKDLNTTDYGGGNYIGVGFLEYGGGEDETAESEYRFRIGELSVDVVNYTKQVLIGGVRNFELEAESNWNSLIDSVYARVDIFNLSENSEIISSFKTSPSSLQPWGKTTVNGFFDTTNFTQGEHRVNMTLIYLGKNRGVEGSVSFIKEKKEFPVYLIYAGIAIILLISAGFFIFRKKNAKKK